MVILWEGFIDLPFTGNWTFEVETRYHFRFSIDDTSVFNILDCGYNPVVTRGFYLAETPGLKKISIEFFKYQSEYSLFLRWAAPDETVLEVIPPSAFFYGPPSQLSYAISETLLATGERIPAMKAVTFASSLVPTSFSAEPSLPAGIRFDEKGDLTGTPNGFSPRTTYHVRGCQGSVCNEGDITLSVRSVTPPRSIKLISLAKELKELQVDIYRSINEIKIEVDDESAQVSVVPELPEGIVRDNRKINGRPLQRVEPFIIYTVTAFNEGGSVSTTLNLTVSGCSNGTMFYTSSKTRTLELGLYREGQEIRYTKELYDPYGFVFCPDEKYEYAARCIHYETCRFRIYREDGALMVDDLIEPREWSNHTLPVKEKTAPKLTIDLPVFTGRRLDSTVFNFDIQGIYRPLQFRPEPVDTFVVDYVAKTMSVSLHHSGLFTYTVTADNNVGASEVVLQLNVGECPKGERYFSIMRSNALPGESYSLAQNGKTLLVEEFNSFSSRRFLCVNDQPYTISFHGNHTWAPFSYLNFRTENGDLAGSFLPSAGESSVNGTELFHFVQPIDRNTKGRLWRDLKAPKKGWTSEKYNEKNWGLSASGHWGALDSEYHTAYIRMPFELSKSFLLPSFSFAVKVNTGCVLYLNGVEVFRINMPVGEVTHDTLGVRVYDLSKPIHVTVPTTTLHDGTNLLAAEFHHYIGSGTTDTIEFAVDSSQVTATSLLLSDKGVATGSDNRPNPFTRPENAFDGRSDTYWMDEELPVSLRYTLPAGHYLTANRLLLEGVEDQPLPSRFQVLGIVNQTIVENGEVRTVETRTLLKTVINVNLFERSLVRVIELDAPRTFTAYEIEIHSARDGEDAAALRNVAFYSESTVVCEKMKRMGATMVGHNAYGSCPWTRVGLLYGHCALTQQGPEWQALDDATCLKRFAGKNEAFIDFAYSLSNASEDLYEDAIEVNLETMLVRELMIKKASVQLFLPRDCTPPNQESTLCVNVRLHPHHLVSHYVMMQLEELNAHLTENFYEEGSLHTPGNITLSVLEKPKLRQRPSASVVVAVVSVSLLAIIVIVFLISYLKVRLAGKEGRVKSLAHTKLPKKKSVNEKLV